MSNHEAVSEMLAEYAAGLLTQARRREVEDHLATCADCRADLVLWQAVRGEVVHADQSVALPAGMADRVVVCARSARRARLIAGLKWVVQLLRSQVALVHHEIWPASTIVMAMGMFLTLTSGQVSVIQALAPLIATASTAILYGSEQDPGYELALATVTSPRQILLARLTLVFSFDLVLMLAASLCLIPMRLLPIDLLGSFILGWLGTMTFLSMAALLISFWIGATNAISLSYLAWILRYLPGIFSSKDIPLGLVPSGLVVTLEAYTRMWANPVILMILALPLAGLALWSAGRADRSLPRWV